MKYCLQGHDRDNGVQEMLISLLPDESHDKVEELSGEGCLSRAWEEDGDICARADIWRGDKHRSAVVQCPIPAETDGEEYKRVLTYNVKSAVYQAMLPLLDNAVASIVCMAVITGCAHAINFLLICHVPSYFAPYGCVSSVSGLINSCTYIGSAISTYGIALISDAYG